MPRSAKRDRSPQVGGGNHVAPILRLVAVALALGACSRSPAQDLVGSFFPAWMLCAAGGIVAAVIIRLILGALGINDYLVAPPLTYVAIAGSATLLIWLAWYGH